MLVGKVRTEAWAHYGELKKLEVTDTKQAYFAKMP